MVGKLVLLLADGTTVDVPLTKERVTIGRRADNDICLPHPAVSGEHASVVTILADSFLEDMGSTNGTLVNGKAIVKHVLRDYDQIDVGRQRLVFVSDDSIRVDPLPVDIARNQLLGLGERVAAVNPSQNVSAPLRGTLGGTYGRGPVVAPLPAYPDLAKEIEELEPPPVAAPRRDAAPPRSSFVEQRPGVTRRESDQRLAAWAAEWAAPSGNSAAGSIDTSAESADVGRAASKTDETMVSGTAAAPTPPDPTVRVLSGPNHGRSVPFAKDELSVGRVGFQVAVIRKVGSGFRLVPVEGGQPPRINGTPVAPEGSELHPGDTFEVAGVRLELSLAN
jgi:pSer/pThr/pTyr-binding forkhead associated (FHA) protein